MHSNSKKAKDVLIIHEKIDEHTKELKEKFKEFRQTAREFKNDSTIKQLL